MAILSQPNLSAFKASLLPRPTRRTRKRAWWHLAKFPYVLSEQSWFRVDESCSHYHNYYAIIKFLTSQPSSTATCSEFWMHLVRNVIVYITCWLSTYRKPAKCHQALSMFHAWAWVRGYFKAALIMWPTQMYVCTHNCNMDRSHMTQIMHGDMVAPYVMNWLLYIIDCWKYNS